jgi:hypothetical protein
MVRSPLWRFVLVFVGAYGCLVAPFPGARDGAAVVCAGLAQATVGQAGGVSFHVLPEVRRVDDRDVAGVVRSGGRRWRFLFQSRRLWHVPTALLIALFLATPMPWRQRLTRGGYALVLLQVFMVIQVGLITWQGAQELALQPVAGEGGPSDVLALLNKTLRRDVGRFGVPVAIWVGTCLYGVDRRAPRQAPSRSMTSRTVASTRDLAL